jgi:transposase
MHKRKDWLFSDTVGGAKASADLLSLVEAGKANGIEPHSYLSRLFVRLPRLRTVDDPESMLPWNVNASLAAVP